MYYFWHNYWWTIIIALVIIISIYLFVRCYYLFRFDYHHEDHYHFPQWSNEGIITRDNYFLHTKFAVIPESKYLIIGIHNLTGTSADFHTTAAILKDHNISFLTFDQRGYGANRKWKYQSITTTINDIKDIIIVINEHYPTQKILLLGEGLGASLASIASKKWPEIISGVILTNGLLTKKPFKTNFKLWAQILWAFCFHKQQTLTINFDLPQLSSNNHYIRMQRQLNNDNITLLLLTQFYRLNKMTVKNINSSSNPILIIQSGENNCGDINKINRYQRQWHDNITYNFYHQGKHALLNEPHIATIVNDMLLWINEANL